MNEAPLERYLREEIEATIRQIRRLERERKLYLVKLDRLRREKISSAKAVRGTGCR